MTNYREILRLHSLGLNNTEIAQSCPCTRTTVIQVLRLAQANNLTYSTPKETMHKLCTKPVFASILITKSVEAKSRNNGEKQRKNEIKKENGRFYLPFFWSE